MAEHKDPIVYRYKPVNGAEGFPDVAQRDLRQSDVDALVGEALRHVTLPEVEHPVYVPVEHRKDETKKAEPKKTAKSKAAPKSAGTKAVEPEPVNSTTEAVVIAAVPPREATAGDVQKGGD
jgi:hypothetical protein